MTLIARWPAYVVLLLLPIVAWAQRDAYEAEVQMERLLEDARAYYDNLELEQAERALDDAIKLASEYRIRNRVLAEVYVQRGILTHVRDKDADGAVRDFAKAIEIDDRTRLDPLVSTPTLQRLFEDAQAQASRGRRRDDRRDDRRDARRDDRRDDRRQPRTESDLKHEPVRNARGGERLPIVVDISDQLNPFVYRVYLYFRSVRADAVQRLEMRPEGNRSFVARINGRFVAGRTLSYYIVVEDRGGKPIAAIRSAKDPILVQIEGDALGALDSIPSGSSLVGGDDGEEDWDDEPGRRGKRKYVSIGISVGTGAGFITDLAQPENQKSAEISPGLAFAPLHTLVELDFWAVDWLALGAFARIQIVEFAHAEGGRVKIRAVNSNGHQLVLRVGGGVGRVRHLVDLGEVLDTTLEGPYFYTVGLSYVFEFNDTVGFIFSPDFLHMIGDSPSPHVDINLGVITSF